jgi:hypothetical protein
MSAHKKTRSFLFAGILKVREEKSSYKAREEKSSYNAREEKSSYKARRI